MKWACWILMLIPLNLYATTCPPGQTIPNPLVIIFAGQSNCHFAQGSGVYSTTGHVTINRNYLVQADFFTPTIVDSISHSSAAVALGDMLYNRFGVDVHIIMTSVGSTSSAQWAGGTESYWLRIATTSVAFPPNLILWNQGETDVALSVTQSTYYVNISSVIANLRNFGVTAPFFISINSSNVSPGVYGSWYPNVRNAQYQTIDAGLALAGPDTDVIRLNSANMDTVHFINAGFSQYANLWYRTILAYYGYDE